jgi:hypothetical protein
MNIHSSKYLVIQVDFYKAHRTVLLPYQLFNSSSFYCGRLATVAEATIDPTVCVFSIATFVGLFLIAVQ